MGRFGDFVGSREDLDRLLTSSAISWNEWRRQNPSKKPNLWAADLEGRSFPGRNLRDADLRHVHFEGADLRRANLRGAILRGSSLDDADLRGADLRDADLSETQLDHPDGGIYTFPTQISGAKLAGCNLASAKLVAANLAYSQLVDVDLSDANLDRAEVYGVATWDVKLHNTQQRALRITRRDQPYMSVDSFELAQFIYLLTDNSKLRDVLDTVSLKTVLILSRFTKNE